MAKILTDKELGEIIHKATHDDSLIECADSYGHFLEDLLVLVCEHFGGTPGSVTEFVGDGLGWTAAVHVDDSVPADGGVFKDYDTDVTWKDGKEDGEDEEDSVEAFRDVSLVEKRRKK